MKKLLIMFTFVILMSSFALAATLSISPGTLELNGKANEEVCNKVILKYSSSESVEGTDLWASQGTEKKLNLYNLKAEDLGITITYPKTVYLNANINKEITVCLTAQNEGIFQGALYFVPVSSSGNQAPGVGTWLSVNIQGVSDIPQFIANEPTTIDANQISLEITTKETVRGNVYISDYDQDIINPSLTAIGNLIDITADPEIVNNLDSAVIKRYYNEDEIVLRGIDENSLKLYYYNPASIQWDELSSVVNTNDNYVQAIISHFSIYGIFGEEIENQDLDGDGITNDVDACPDTPAGKNINSEGCSCSQLIVDDGNVCTDDLCTDGIVTHTNNNAQCGNARNCPSDSCSGNNWLDYPDDGHDYCSEGSCHAYSCAAISSNYDPNCNADEDADDDGVIDSLDSCPDTPAGKNINSEGCSCSQLIVDDGNVCTDDLCTDGIVTHTNNNAQCGNARNCPSDSCSGNNWLDYPDDGHDYCSAGECDVYSCALISSTYKSRCRDRDKTKRSSSRRDTYLMATVTNTVPSCIEDWSCTKWGECINSKQIRTCKDKNKCGTKTNKPAELRSCIFQKTNLLTNTIVKPKTNDLPDVLVGGLVMFSIVVIGLVSYLLLFPRGNKR